MIPPPPAYCRTPHNLHKIFTPDRIRQKIGRIGKALLRHSLLSFGNSGAVKIKIEGARYPKFHEQLVGR
jgi:hypothetical protein